MEMRANYYSKPEPIRSWTGGDDYFGSPVIGGSPVKVKQREDMLKEFTYKKYCTPPQISSSKSKEKIWHAGSKQSGQTCCSLELKNVSKMVKDTQVDEDVENSPPVIKD